MITQSATVNRRLANIITVGVVFTILCVVAGTLWILFSYRQVLDMRTEYAQLKYTAGKLRSGQGNVPEEQAVQNTVVILPVKEQLEPGKEITTPAVEKNEVKQEGSASTDENAEHKDALPVNRKDIVVWYFLRKADNESLQIALKSLGYNYNTKKLDKNTGYQKSNCIWFGTGVPLADVKRVAIAMIQSGNTVKGIKRFPVSTRNPSYKRNVIEVGMEIKYETYYTKPLSIVEVERANNFK